MGQNVINFVMTVLNIWSLKKQQSGSLRSSILYLNFSIEYQMRSEAYRDKNIDLSAIDHTVNRENWLSENTEIPQNSPIPPSSLATDSNSHDAATRRMHSRCILRSAPDVYLLLVIVPLIARLSLRQSTSPSNFAPVAPEQRRSQPIVLLSFPGSLDEYTVHSIPRGNKFNYSHVVNTRRPETRLNFAPLIFRTCPRT